MKLLLKLAKAFWDYVDPSSQGSAYIPIRRKYADARIKLGIINIRRSIFFKLYK